MFLEMLRKKRKPIDRGKVEQAIDTIKTDLMLDMISVESADAVETLMDYAQRNINDKGSELCLDEVLAWCRANNYVLWTKQSEKCFKLVKGEV